jgi:L-threonylcarbamoyladenylate synthase
VAPLVAEAIIAAKGREAGKPLQVVYPSLELLQTCLALPPRLGDAVRRLLPGPFTLLLPYPAGLAFPPPGEVPHRTQGTFGVRTRTVRTIGVRVPAWPDAGQVLAGLPFALLASSANLSGEPAPDSIEAVDPGLLEACDLVLDAGRVHGEASSVLDLSVFAEDGTWRILRAGGAGEDRVAALLEGAARDTTAP